MLQYCHKRRSETVIWKGAKRLGLIGPPQKTNEWVQEELVCILCWWIPTLIEIFYVQFYEKVAVQMAPRMVPPRLQRHFSQENYERSRQYTLARLNFGVFSSIYKRVIETMTVFVILRFGFPQFIGNALSQEKHFLLILVYSSLLYLLFKDLADLPLEIYFTFVLQENYGLNRLTCFTFLQGFLDKIVPDVIQLLLIHAFNGSIVIGKDALLFILFIKLLFGHSLPSFPLYRSFLRGQKPLKNGPLKDKLESLAEHFGFPKKEIYIFNDSKSSSGSNAYYLGIFFKRRIVLYDSLIKSYQCKCVDRNNCHCERERGLTNPEVEAVFCHELGHWSRGHFRKGFKLSLAMSLIWSMLRASNKFSWISKYFAQKIWNLYGFELGGIITFNTFTVLNYESIHQLFIWVSFIAIYQFTKTFEFEADEIAVNRGYGYSLQSGLIKLYKDNLVFPISDPLYSKLYHTHPTLIERLEAIDQRIHELQ